jgi:hypothetical protein
MEFIFLQHLSWFFNYNHDMLSPQSWSELITNAKRKAVTAETIRDDVVKKRKAEDTVTVHTCAFDLERMEALERQVEEFINSTATAFNEVTEELQKAQGMLKFCYAICQNPGVKDLADRNRGPSAASALSSFASRSYGRGAGSASGSAVAKPFIPRP